MSNNHTARLALAENIEITISQKPDIPVARCVGQEETTTPSSYAASCEDTETADFIAFMRDLDELMRDSGPNKNEMAINLITACIERGFDTRRRIRGIAENQRLNPNHVMSILNRETGTCPTRHRWRVSNDERYSLLG